MKPICVGCHRFFKVRKNGLFFVEGMPTETGAQPGLAEPQYWKPYKLWSGDVWECPGCKAQIISGTGPRPLAEHYEPDFPAMVDRYRAEFQVNDC